MSKINVKSLNDGVSWICLDPEKNQCMTGRGTILDFENHAERMGFEILAERPNLSIFNAPRIGIEIGNDENAAIGHVHLSDMR